MSDKLDKLKLLFVYYQIMYEKDKNKPTKHMQLFLNILDKPVDSDFNKCYETDLEMEKFLMQLDVHALIPSDLNIKSFDLPILLQK